MIELIITLTVLAILIAIAAPGFAEFFEKSRLRGAADEIVTMLAGARSEAVKRNRDVQVNFGGSTAAWCVGANVALDPAAPGDAIPAAVACDCTNAAQCLIGGQRVSADAARFPGVTATNVTDAFVFDRSLGTQHEVGSDTPSAATTTLTSKSGRFGVRVDVSPLGHATTCIPSGKPLIAGYSSC